MNAARDLEAMLRTATSADNWSKVIHRCAWCARLFDEDGAYANLAAFERAIVATDGMCPACGTRALRQIARTPGSASCSLNTAGGNRQLELLACPACLLQSGEARLVR